MKEDIYPPMHTAEHLLNQTMVRMFDCGRCFSAHIEKKKSKCDYHFDRNLTAEEVSEIETRVNTVIQADLTVSETTTPSAEIKATYGRDFTDEQVRVILIGNYDSIPCYGPHVASTKEIGAFHIISTDWSDGVLRIRYKLTVTPGETK